MSSEEQKPTQTAEGGDPHEEGRREEPLSPNPPQQSPQPMMPSGIVLAQPSSLDGFRPDEFELENIPSDFPQTCDPSGLIKPWMAKFPELTFELLLETTAQKKVAAGTHAPVCADDPRFADVPRTAFNYGRTTDNRPRFIAEVGTQVQIWTFTSKDRADLHQERQINRYRQSESKSVAPEDNDNGPDKIVPDESGANDPPERWVAGSGDALTTMKL